MPSILNDEDKDTVKRFVPKQSNKIQAVAVARLYVAYPNRSKWNYTGLQGAVVLANDLVGNTYWLKMVDISPSARGVVWDQEIFDSWAYNQDRTFFHTFELEDCLAGLSFVDEKEAKQFKKKMDEREKNASRATRSTPFGGSGGAQPTHKHSLLGGLFHRHSSAPSPSHAPQAGARPSLSQASSIPSLNQGDGLSPSEFALLDTFDPLWREHFGQDLRDKGLTDDFIRDNQEFIVDFLREEQAKMGQQRRSPSSAHSGPHAPPPPPPTNGNGRAPPPPPPGAATATSPTSARRGVPPPPPPAPRRSGKSEQALREPSPPAELPSHRPRFNAPPPLPEAGRFAHVEKARPAVADNPGPPPPPRPAKTPLDGENGGPKFHAPPPFTGQRLPPPTPNRSPVPPPPPPRSNDHHGAMAAHPAAPPPLPPKVANRNSPPPLPPPGTRPAPPPIAMDVPPPPPPPLPSSNRPPPCRRRVPLHHRRCCLQPPVVHHHRRHRCCLQLLEVLLRRRQCRLRLLVVLRRPRRFPLHRCHLCPERSLLHHPLRRRCQRLEVVRLRLLRLRRRPRIGIRVTLPAYLLRRCRARTRADRRCWAIFRKQAESALSRRSIDRRSETEAPYRSEAAAIPDLTEVASRPLALFPAVAAVAAWPTRWRQRCRRERRKSARAASIPVGERFWPRLTCGNRR
ncbi:hypothetical protein DCS_00919 [Drechmeria coniospora]|uniref:WH1 domain-containing protein n=1 Tax=Drechmeria coniospora TaxID=98403 RepID=A0A151GRP9_DRECN|nr:hypothetical protein DCS_00919 [Drechmeria coniospora]KYK59785.1 hypothetical protein DCS_00919 [Drechmeria coniospora]